MFFRGIRGISIENNISAVVFGSKGSLSPIELTRQLIFSEHADPSALLLTPAGEVMFVFEKERGAELEKSYPDALFIKGLAKLSVFGARMNEVGAKIYRTLCDAEVHVLGVSTCDIAVSFITREKDSARALASVRNNFILEV